MRWKKVVPVPQVATPAPAVVVPASPVTQPTPVATPQAKPSPTVTKYTQYCFVSVGGVKTKTGEVQVGDPNSTEQQTLCRPINAEYAAKKGYGQSTGHSMDNQSR